MTTADEKKSLPTWLKALLIAGSVLIVCVLVLIGGAIWLYNSSIKTETEDIKKTLASVVTFKQPLSNNYQYKMAIDAAFAGARIGVVTYEPDKLMIMVATQNAKPLTPQQVVEQFPVAPGKSASRSSKFVKEKDGEEIVAGQKMPFISGKTVDATGAESQIFVGSIILEQPKQHSVFIVATGDEPKPIDGNVLHEFLQNIESFK